jgi:integrase
MMADLRNIMNGIFAKAQEREILPDSFASPMHRVKLPKKWEVREKRILDEDQTERVLARLEDPHRLINETCVDTGTRISEVTGLMIKHVDLDLGCLRIEQRNWRGDIDEPKTTKSRRPLALGALTERYRIWIAGLEHRRPDAWVFPQDDDCQQPMWGSGVRKELHKAAAAEGCDFLGLGAAFPAARQHHVATGGRRQQHRDLSDRRPRQYEDHRAIHCGPASPPGGTDAADSGQARQGGEANQGRQGCADQGRRRRGVARH